MTNNVSTRNKPLTTTRRKRNPLCCEIKRLIFTVPCNLLILPLPRLHAQALFIHLLHIGVHLLHRIEDILLQLRHGLQRVRRVLVLLDVADDLGRLGALGEVDEVRALDDGGDTVFDEGEVGEVDAWREGRGLVDWECERRGRRGKGSSWVCGQETGMELPKNGMHGGQASFSVSR